MQGFATDRTGRPRTLAPFALAFALLSVPATAQTVQKCVAGDGHVTLTSGKCAVGERLVASYEAAPEQVPAERGATSAATATAGTTRASNARGRGRSYASAPPRARRAVDRCQKARGRRDRTLERAGLKRNFDMLRKLDDEVWVACGRP